MRFKTVILLFSLLAAAPVWAGQELSVRLVEASNRKPTRKLGDGFGFMRSNLPFSQFETVDRKSMPLPAAGEVQLQGGFRVVCSGDQFNLTVSIYRHGALQLTTILSLQDGKPAVLGGFPGESGRLLVELVAR